MNKGEIMDKRQVLEELNKSLEKINEHLTMNQDEKMPFDLIGEVQLCRCYMSYLLDTQIKEVI